MDVTIIDAETGEVIQRSFTSEERAAHDAMVAADAQREAELIEAEKAKAAARASAIAKLEALGLTENEAAALVGA